ncbi:MAG: hypothetical protein ACYDAO_08510 [Thermoplasmataceae archaeon]
MKNIGIECEQLGKTVIYRRDGTKFEIDHKTTVEICEESLSSGKEFHEIIKKKIEPEVKTIRFVFEDL